MDRDMMQEWMITYQDTANIGLRETNIGTKYLRYLANRVGACSPEVEWLWSKVLYPEVGMIWGRRDWKTVERSCRAAIERARLKVSNTELVYELAEIAWDRRREYGVPDAAPTDMEVFEYTHRVVNGLRD
jgi:hypothetical protein